VVGTSIRNAHPHMGPPESSVPIGLEFVVVLVERGGARSHA
jgi:hypothetical protein